jgi:tRNA 2-thiocytidine biosynthesis protein TtcA
MSAEPSIDAPASRGEPPLAGPRPGYSVRVHLRPPAGARGPVPRRTPDARLEKKLLQRAGQAIAQFSLIEDGDRILVGISGGKDSFTLLHLLQLLQQRAPVRFELVACNLDQGQPGFPAARLEEYLREQQVEAALLYEDTYAVVKRLVPEGKTTCAVCSRLRRGILYRAARELGCSKIALGHHRDDLIESLLLSMLFAGKTRSMPPKLRSDDGQSTVIRPLCSAAEQDLAAFAESAGFPIIPCDLCGSQENLQRKRVKRLLSELEREHGGVRDSLFAAMGNLMPAHLLDPRLHPGAASGKDPWIDEDERELEPCAAPSALISLTSLGPRR